MAKYSDYTIDYQSLKSGLSEFKFPVTKALFEFWKENEKDETESEVVDGSGEIVISINKNGSVAQMDTRINALVSVPCDRCLDLVEVPVVWEGQCVIKVSDQQGEYDGEIIWVGTRENMIDFAQYLYESIVLGLPICRTHKDIKECNQDVVKFLNVSE